MQTDKGAQSTPERVAGNGELRGETQNEFAEEISARILRHRGTAYEHRNRGYQIYHAPL